MSTFLLRISGTLLAALALGWGGLAPVRPAAADPAQFGGRALEPSFRPIAFPVAGFASYSDTWHAPRSGGRVHLGTDVFAPKHTPLVAVTDGVVAWIRGEDAGLSGRMLTIRDDDGWQYRYIHLNNDTPGTDDGAAPLEQTFAPGIEVGTRVQKGQVIAYLGDSGNAEGTPPHVHFEILGTDRNQINPFPSLRLSQGQRVGNLCSFGSNPVGRPDPSAGDYHLLDRAGGVFTFGTAGYHGSIPGLRAAGRAIPPVRVVAVERTPSGNGYWVLDETGGVFTFGDATFHGSVPGLRAAGQAIPPVRVVAVERTPSGNGYWVLDETGGVFTFGDATFHGSVPGLRAGGQPIGRATAVAMVAPPEGGGYWIADDRGGVFGFGAVGYHGSVPGTGLCEWAPIVDMERTATGQGYWMVAEDGRVFAFGDAPYHGAADVGLPAAGGMGLAGPS